MPPYETSLLSLIESTILGFRKTIGRRERNRLSNIGRLWKNRYGYLERVRGAQGSSLRVWADGPNLDEDPKKTLNLECVLVSPATRARARRRNFVADA